MIMARLMRIFDIVRPGIPVPTILQFNQPVGKALAQEIEGYGAMPNYVAKLVPQIHADMDQQTAQTIAKSGLQSTIWYDEPTYSFADPGPSPFRSTRSQIEQRIANRVRINTGGNPHPVYPETIRAHLGAGRPVRLGSEEIVFDLEDVRAFTRSKQLYEAGLTGRGVRVALLDTGIDETHPMLEGQVEQALSFVPEEPGTDNNGHGTWCASAIAGLPTEYNGKIASERGKVLQGMAPEARLLALKVLTGEGSGASSGIIQAIDSAVQSGVDIISMSLGNLFGGGGLMPDAQAVNAATKKGVRCVIAAGNSFGWLTVGSPGSATGAITVASIAMKQPAPGIVSSFSSKGPTSSGQVKPSIAAPGGNVRPGEVILGATSRGGVIDRESMDSGWALLRGTSMATPTVAGIFAQLVPAGLPKDRALLEEALARSVHGAVPGLEKYRVPRKNNRTGWGPIDAMQLQRAINTKAGPLIRFYGEVVSQHGRPLIGQTLDLIGATFNSLPVPKPDTIRLTLV